MNNGGEFGRSIFYIYIYIYPKEVELNVEHQGDHATFFNFDITIKKEIFTYQLFD